MREKGLRVGEETLHMGLGTSIKDVPLVDGDTVIQW